MTVKLTGGRHSGRTVTAEAPAGIRPTASKVRAALFNILGQDLTGWSVLDGFGGTGLLGFEAWSRGAASVTVCEKSGPACRSIGLAAQALGAQVEIVRGDLSRLLAAGRTWDVALLDPPYAEDPVPWLERVAAHVTRVVVVEHEATRTLPDRIGARLVLDRTRTYGDTALSVYDVVADS